ncbi:MAG: hypothetical protein JWO80_4412 [Bryobacterales bacterium]|nr:hypothetical protein [Bryobacterales bacterium]
MDESGNNPAVDVEAIVQRAVQEYMRQDVSKKEPAYKAELHEERRRREQLEKRLNEVVAESQRNRKIAEEAERSSSIRAELQQLGVAKVDLAYKAVQDGIFRGEDGRLLAHSENGEIPAKEYLASFVSDNPEFLPARIPGGSGMTSGYKSPAVTGGAIDLDKISPAMDKAELERVRQEILRVASQTLRGV